MPKTEPTYSAIKQADQHKKPESRVALGRRALFAEAVTLVATPAVIAAPKADAELIDRCHRFAEDELAFWYQCALSGNDAEEDHWDVIEAERRWIETARASTAEGWQAQALACSVWEGGMSDATDPSAMMASRLMLEAARPARSAMLARMAERFGPLPQRV